MDLLTHLERRSNVQKVSKSSPQLSILSKNSCLFCHFWRNKDSPRIKEATTDRDHTNWARRDIRLLRLRRQCWTYPAPRETRLMRSPFPRRRTLVRPRVYQVRDRRHLQDQHRRRHQEMGPAMGLFRLFLKTQQQQRIEQKSARWSTAKMTPVISR